MMDTSVLQFLERSVERFPDKPALISPTDELTYTELTEQARRVGSCLAKLLAPRSAVAIFMERNVWEAAAIYGVTYSGCVSAPLDPATPAERVLKVFETLEPACILVDDTAKALLADLEGRLSCPVLTYAEAAAQPADDELLAARRAQATILDPVQIFYTSGSTGIPKGVVHTHGSILHYASTTQNWPELIHCNQIYGNQSPFYYAHAINDIYISFSVGCTVRLIPNEIFMFPDAFLKYFNEYKISTCVMTPLNYVYIADAGVLSPGCLPCLDTVYMSGEVVPYNKMRIWADAACNAVCCNFYGSTEAPYTAQYAIGEKEFAPGEPVPAGETLPGVQLFLLDENGDQVPQGEIGEIYITSPQLAAGYYRDRERTQAVFLDDPLNWGWNQTFFRTGDRGRLNEDGDLIVVGRQDTQIKHRGYRMDLSEVEIALRNIEGWQNGCCLFSEEEDYLYCFWCGPLTEQALKAGLKPQLEKYMIPNVWVHLEDLPRTNSGKLNRLELKKKHFGRHS